MGEEVGVTFPSSFDGIEYGNIRSRDTGIKWTGLMVAWNKGLFPCIVFFHSEPSAPHSTTVKVNGLLDQRILPGNSCWAAAVLHMVKTAFREEPPAAEEHGSGPIFHSKTLEHTFSTMPHGPTGNKHIFTGFASLWSPETPIAQWM
jgi:hypothetical protein